MSQLFRVVLSPSARYRLHAKSRILSSANPPTYRIDRDCSITVIHDADLYVVLGWRSVACKDLAEARSCLDANSLRPSREMQRNEYRSKRRYSRKPRSYGVPNIDLLVEGHGFLPANVMSRAKPALEVGRCSISWT